MQLRMNGKVQKPSQYVKLIKTPSHSAGLLRSRSTNTHVPNGCKELPTLSMVLSVSMFKSHFPSYSLHSYARGYPYTKLRPLRIYVKRWTHDHPRTQQVCVRSTEATISHRSDDQKHTREVVHNERSNLDAYHRY